MGMVLGLLSALKAFLVPGTCVWLSFHRPSLPTRIACLHAVLHTNPWIPLFYLFVVGCRFGLDDVCRECLGFSEFLEHQMSQKSKRIPWSDVLKKAIIYFLCGLW